MVSKHMWGGRPATPLILWPRETGKLSKRKGVGEDKGFLSSLLSYVGPKEVIAGHWGSKALRVGGAKPKGLWRWLIDSRAQNPQS